MKFCFRYHIVADIVRERIKSYTEKNRYSKFWRISAKKRAVERL